MAAGTAPVALTPVAADRLAELCRDGPTKPIVRLYLAGRGCCGYRYGLAHVDEPGANDLATDVGNVQLIVDPDIEQECSGVTIDYVTTPDGEGFTIQGPRTGGCGCGGP